MIVVVKNVGGRGRFWAKKNHFGAKNKEKHEFSICNPETLQFDVKTTLLL